MLTNTAIRPRIPLWFHVICTLFVAAGLGLMVDAIYVGNQLPQFVAGLFSLLVFCCAWAIAGTVFWLRPVTLMLQSEGIWYYSLRARGLIPWRDIKKVGAVDVLGVRSLGLRLDHYENYRSTLVATRADRLGQMPPYPEAQVLRLLHRLETMRRSYGYDIVVPAILLDRSISELIMLVEDSRREYGRG